MKAKFFKGRDQSVQVPNNGSNNGKSVLSIVWTKHRPTDQNDFKCFLTFVKKL